MLAEPLRIPGRAIAGSLKELVVKRKDDRIELGPFTALSRRATLTPHIVMKALLSVILVSADDGFLWGHRVDRIGDIASRIEERGEFGEGSERPLQVPTWNCPLERNWMRSSSACRTTI